ncbi:sensor histidine kinase [Halonatronum saccharophilum]|uniref:sensor histidine kinase n=1 Tax=Halonatronum saccharophilum TaxID=150060 RepID=UPI00047FD294|nr:HAMP domain-containing sensor histidine kinase [Halonatronum saccharophilum]
MEKVGGKSSKKIESKLERLIDKGVKVEDLYESLDLDKESFIKFLEEKFYEERIYIYEDGLEEGMRRANKTLQMFLKATEGDKGYVRRRANLMGQMGDLIYFTTSHKQGLKGEKEAISWLEKALDEDRENYFAKGRLKDLKRSLLLRQQIDKFNHDASSKISFLRDKVRGMIKEEENKRIEDDLLEVYEQIEVIEGIFRLTKGEGPKFEIVNIEELLKNLVLSFPELDEKALYIKGESRDIEVDRSYLIIALRNLIKNALDAYRSRGIEISDRPIILTFNYDRLTFKVKDKAGGIEEKLKDKDRLFSPYVSSKGSYQNVGLGLALVKEAVQLQGGSIDYSNKDGGAEFIIKLEEGEF